MRNFFYSQVITFYDPQVRAFSETRAKKVTISLNVSIRSRVNQEKNSKKSLYKIADTEKVELQKATIQDSKIVSHSEFKERFYIGFKNRFSNRIQKRFSHGIFLFNPRMYV